jgi:hypothetical protein
MATVSPNAGLRLLQTEPTFALSAISGPITKHNYLVTRPEDIADTIRAAFYIARSGRPGPVLVDICKDAQQQKCTFEWHDEPVSLPGYRPVHVVAESSIGKAAALINRAVRPLVLCGHGVIESGSTDVLDALVTRADMPVACTLLGLGAFPASHPKNLGTMGMHGEALFPHGHFVVSDAVFGPTPPVAATPSGTSGAPCAVVCHRVRPPSIQDLQSVVDTIERRARRALARRSAASEGEDPLPDATDRARLSQLANAAPVADRDLGRLRGAAALSVATGISCATPSALRRPPPLRPSRREPAPARTKGPLAAAPSEGPTHQRSSATDRCNTQTEARIAPRVVLNSCATLATCWPSAAQNDFGGSVSIRHPDVVSEPMWRHG